MCVFCFSQICVFVLIVKKTTTSTKLRTPIIPDSHTFQAQKHPELRGSLKKIKSLEVRIQKKEMTEKDKKENFEIFSLQCFA